MAKPKERAPAEFVRMPASDEQLLGLWERVEQGQARRRARARQLRRGAASGAVVAVLVGALALTWSRDPAPVAAGGATDEASRGTPSALTALDSLASSGDPSAGSDAPRELALADGSHLSLGAGARARVLVMRSDEVRVRLDRGEVACDVEPAGERRFVVEAGAFEVLVTGTRFTVAVGGDAALASSVAVGVERGSVEVREPSGRLLAALTAGQRWASERPVEAPDAGAAEPVLAPPSTLPPANPSPASQPASNAPASKDPASKAPALKTPALKTPPAGDPARAASGEPRPGPAALLALASEARQAGKPAEAAAALQELVRKYPTDDRAGYAAFLLGRLQLDALGDARAAVDSFSFAVAHPGSGFFTEDAEARQIEALARAGRAAECARARDRFLATHPGAARAAAVRRACDAK